MTLIFCGNSPHLISDALKCIGSASDPAWELIVGVRAFGARHSLLQLHFTSVNIKQSIEEIL